MNLQAIMNSPGMWIVSSLMIIAILGQSILFFCTAWKRAQEIGITKQERVRGIRAAMITTIGPSFGPVVVLIALIAVLGAPTAWMRMNDIGAARTELAMSALATNVYGVDLHSAAFDLKAFSYALWGMAVNNVGWMIVTLISVKKMSGIFSKMREKYDVNWINLLIAGVSLGLFAYLWSGSGIKDVSNLVASLISFAAMFIIARVARKRPRLREFGLGIAMLIGMFVTAAYF